MNSMKQNQKMAEMSAHESYWIHYILQISLNTVGLLRFIETEGEALTHTHTHTHTCMLSFLATSAWLLLHCMVPQGANERKMSSLVGSPCSCGYDNTYVAICSYCHRHYIRCVLAYHLETQRTLFMAMAASLPEMRGWVKTSCHFSSITTSGEQ